MAMCARSTSHHSSQLVSNTAITSANQSKQQISSNHIKQHLSIDVSKNNKLSATIIHNYHNISSLTIAPQPQQTTNTALIERSKKMVKHLIDAKFEKINHDTTNPNKKMKLDPVINNSINLLDIICFNAHGMNQSENYVNILALKSSPLSL